MKNDYKILNISKEFNGATRNGDAFHGYVFVGETKGKQHTGELVYFCYVGNVKLEKDGFYRGSIVKQTGVDKNGKPKNDIFKDVQKIDGFDGIEDPFAPTHTQNEVDEHQAKMEAWGHIHSATSLLAGMSLDGDEQRIINNIVRVAGICKKAHDELTQQYIDMDKEEK